MSRIPLITTRADLDADARAAFDRIVESRGEMLRPFQVLLHSPLAAERVAELGHVLRFGSQLADADRELVTLATGRALGCAFVWESHLQTAAAAGVPAATLAALETDGMGTGLSGRDEVLIAFVRELCATGAVTEGTFSAVRALLGTTASVELALTVGYYAMLGYVMSVAEAC